MYKITAHSRKQARLYGVEIRPSVVKGKKIDVFNKNGVKVASIGNINFKDYGTYLVEKGKAYADERRRLYRIRHRGENNYSLKILW